MTDPSVKSDKTMSTNLTIATPESDAATTTHMDSKAKNNPYQTPSASIDPLPSVVATYNQSKWYHCSGRIGRLRYLTYKLLMSFLMYAALFLIFIALTDNAGPSDASAWWMIAISLPLLPIFFYTSIVYPRRRLHDLDQSGWVLLITFVPLVNVIFYLYLIFARGSEGSNRFGAPPRPNRAVHYIGAFLMPILMIIGILTVIALPAYANYTEHVIQQSIDFNSQ